MLVKVLSATLSGMHSVGVEVEVNVASRGLPGLDIVGLGDKAIQESKDRIRTAIANSKLEFPQRRITVNLAPADVPKEGSLYDLPIAVGILSSVMKYTIPDDALFFGELSLDGGLRHGRGALLLALFAKEKGFRKVFVPMASANEASAVGGVDVYGVRSLTELLAHLLGVELLRSIEHVDEMYEQNEPEFDMSEIAGQEQAKRACVIAAAGGHNVLMSGSPGVGKTMLARACSGILPPLTDREALEVTKLYSVSGRIPPHGGIIRERPFRAPHHTISSVGLIGGGTIPQPGEVSLAHRGVLFMDEFNEFPRMVLEALRQPIEDGCITISRSREHITYPSEFMLIAAANPCPCGYLGHPHRVCTCSPREIERYRKRVSGPILDRIDLHIQMDPVAPEKLQYNGGDEPQCTSRALRETVERARQIQLRRFADVGITTNAEMRNSHIKTYVNLSPESEQLLLLASTKHHLSARTYFKLIKVARTIADLAGSGSVEREHVAEALQFRQKLYDERGC